MMKSSGIMGNSLVTMSEGLCGLSGDFSSFLMLPRMMHLGIYNLLWPDKSNSEFYSKVGNFGDHVDQLSKDIRTLSSLFDFMNEINI